MVASALAAAIIGRQDEVTSAEAAVALYEKIAALIYDLSPYAAIKKS